MNNDPPIRPMSEREFQLIPVDEINVPNPRKRCEKQFQENLRSIKETGLRKPITVNRRFYAKTGKYDLVCGQGRWEIHKKLGKTHIMAEVIDVDKKEAYILSLVENVARVRPASIEFARSIVYMYDSGVSVDQLSKITGHTRNAIQDYLLLMKNGEERLIKGVEDGIYTITFAKNVAKSNDGDVQRLLMDAFEDGMITASNLKEVRDILESRRRNPNVKQYRDLDDLKKTIQEMTERKRIECGQAKRKESRLYRLLNALHEFRNDKNFLELMKENGVSLTLNLKGNYDYR